MAQTYEDKLTLEAFNGKLGKIELIRSETPELTARYLVPVDFTGFDWDAWSVIFVGLRYAGFHNPYSGSGAYAYIDFIMANSHTIYGKRSPGFGALSQNSPMSVLLFPRHSAQNKLWALSLPEADVAFSDGTYAELQTLRFCNSSSDFPTPVTLSIYGIR